MGIEKQFFVLIHYDYQVKENQLKTVIISENFYYIEQRWLLELGVQPVSYMSWYVNILLLLLQWNNKATLLVQFFFDNQKFSIGPK